MQDVPKIVQARLRRATPATAEAHPDADLLTAFVEQSLTESERGQVMEHLARCGDCRDVVAIALPATEDVAISGSARVSRSAWLSRPVLRWGVVAAGMVLVTSVGILQYRQRQQQSEIAARVVSRKETPATVAQNPPAASQAPSPQAEVPQTQVLPQTQVRKTTSSRALAAQSAATTEQPAGSLNGLLRSQPIHGAISSGGGSSGFGGGTGSGSGRAVTNYEAQSQRDSLALAPESKEATTAASRNPADQPLPAAPAQQVAIPRALQMVEVQSETVQVATAQNPTELPAQNGPSTNLDVVKAKNSEPPQDASSVAFAPTLQSPNIPLQTPPSLGQRAAPRWTISSAGALQRSFDAGKTWEDVHVSEDVNARADSPALRLQKQSAIEDKYAGGKKVAVARPTPALVFRAVAAIGPEVWAGGSDALLYHSADSGTHFTRVLPSEGGAVLSGDVLSIRFSDARNGTVTTSTAERWSTADAGQTWHKQQ